MRQDRRQLQGRRQEGVPPEPGGREGDAELPRRARRDDAPQLQRREDPDRAQCREAGRRRGVEAAAIVGDREEQLVARDAPGDPDFRRVSVPNAVERQFAHDAQDHVGRVVREPVARHVEADGDLGVGDVRGERQADGMLPYPVQVLCDDFATGCRIPDFDKTISIFREKRISAVMLVQSETQLASMYGQMAAKTIINNCDTLVYLGGMDIDTCSSIARRANVPMEDVTTMKVGQEIYFRRGMKPVFTQRYDVTADNAYIQSHGSAR